MGVTKMTNPAQLKAMGELLVERGLTWRRKRVKKIQFLGDKVHLLYFSHYEISGICYDVVISLEQWLFDPKFELAKCVWKVGDNVCSDCGEDYEHNTHLACKIGELNRPYEEDWRLHLKKALFAPNRLQYLLDSLDLHGEEGLG